MSPRDAEYYGFKLFIQDVGKRYLIENKESIFFAYPELVGDKPLTPGSADVRSWQIELMPPHPISFRLSEKD